jgi:hypothetical protein
MKAPAFLLALWDRLPVGLVVFWGVLLPCAYAYDGPLVDGHAHWGGSFAPQAIIERYRASRVVAQVVMPRYLGVREDLPTTDEAVLAIAARYPGEIFVLAGMQRPDFTHMDWNAPHDQARRILAEVDRKLAEGKVYGIGELLVRHWAYAGDGGRIGPHAEIDKGVDTVFFREVATVAMKHDVPLVIHMEGYPELVQQLDGVLREMPRLKLVWSHGCGRLRPEVINDLIKRHSRLFCDLSNMTNTGGYGSGWPRAEAFTSMMEKDGAFLPAYRSLINDYPERFFIGMDVAHQSRWLMRGGNTFEVRIRRTRELLAQLPTQVAERLAYGNVMDLFRLKLPAGAIR